MTATPELSAWLGRRREIAEGAKGGATPTRGGSTPTQGSGNNSPRAQGGAPALLEIEAARKLWLSFNVVAHQKDVLQQFIERIRQWLAAEEGDAAEAGDRKDLLAEAEQLLSKKGSNGHAFRGNQENGANGDVRLENERLRLELEALRTENAELKAAGGHRQASPSPEDGRSAEGRLRHALNDRNTTTDQLRQAILGVESMVGEAKRELDRAEQRDRRAAYEALHAAMTGDDDFKLQCAIDSARYCEVASDDIAKAEGKLAELQAMTPEQRRAKEREKRLKTQKTEAFNLVKKNNVALLQACLEALDEDVRWRDWKDYQGRTLWRFAQQVQASDVLVYLGPLVGESTPSPTNRNRKSSADAELARAAALAAAASTPEPPQREEPAEAAPAAGAAAATAPAQAPAPEGAREKEPEVKASSTPTSAARSAKPAVSINLLNPGPTPDRGDASKRDLSPITPQTMISPRAVDPSDPIAVARAKAFRAVVNEDLDSLEEVLESVEVEVWNGWENKAGEDLLALSQRRSTRGSTVAYTFIAQRLGLLKEQQREAFEEQEAVWVFAPGEVQPRRATVKEDTPEDADVILVEFWDGNEEAERVERCLVRKGNT